MTNSISSTSSVSSSSAVSSTSSDNSTLKKLKEQLQALGVDTSNITTVAQAQEKLKEVQSSSNSGSQKKPSQNNALSSSINSLALKVGVSVASGEKPDDTLSKISSKISSLRSEAGDDQTKLAKAEGYQTEYDSIQNQINSLKSQMAGSMQGLSNYNKASLGLS